MRTPLESSLHILAKVLNTLMESDKLTQEKLFAIVDWVRLTLSSLTLTQSYVQDLLGITQLNENQLSLEAKPFSPKEVIDFVQAIFVPLVEAKRKLKLEVEVVNHLPIDPKKQKDKASSVILLSQ